MLYPWYNNVKGLCLFLSWTSQGLNTGTYLIMQYCIFIFTLFHTLVNLVLRSLHFPLTIYVSTFNSVIPLNQSPNCLYLLTQFQATFISMHGSSNLARANKIWITISSLSSSSLVSNNQLHPTNTQFAYIISAVPSLICIRYLHT